MTNVPSGCTPDFTSDFWASACLSVDETNIRKEDPTISAGENSLLFVNSHTLHLLFSVFAYLLMRRPRLDGDTP